mgnify:FL=1
MIAIYPGSFDPVTNGHLDMIKRSASAFDEVVVGVLVNYSKNSLFTMDERIEMLEELLYDYSNVKVKKFSGLLVDFVIEEKADAVVRGLRAVSDYEAELQMAHINKNLADNKLETLFMVSSPEYSFLSSSVVKEIASLGGDVSKLVPKCVNKKIRNKLK